MALPVGQPRSDRVFERLYRRHIDDVYRYALAVLGNRADAEDVTQTAFLNAYRAFQSGQQPERPLNWLIAITHNVCRQRFRDAARRPREVVIDRELAMDSGEDDGRGYRQEDIRRALAQLSFSQRAALAMRELEGRSYKEIAQILDVTESAVETLIFRARRGFREQLESSLSCSEAERAISRQLDGMLSRGEKAELRAHLRACEECASIARRLRAQRSALKGIAFLPLPPSLASFSGGGSVAGGAGAALGTGLAIKVATLGAVTVVAAGIGTHVIPVTSSSSSPSKPKIQDVATPAQLVSERRVVPSRPSIAATALDTRPTRGSNDLTLKPKPVRLSRAKAHGRLTKTRSSAPWGRTAPLTPHAVTAVMAASRHEHTSSGNNGQAHLQQNVTHRSNGGASRVTPEKQPVAPSHASPAASGQHAKSDKPSKRPVTTPTPRKKSADAAGSRDVPATATTVEVGTTPTTPEDAPAAPPDTHLGKRSDHAADAAPATSHGQGEQKP